MQQLNLFNQTKSKYFNTTNLRNPELLQKKVKAKSQQEIVKEYFEQHPSASVTRDELHSYLGLTCKPDSVGRCLTNLTNEGFLVRTGILRLGRWGAVQHAYERA